MTDRLAEIKARHDQWSTVTPVCIAEDADWLIAKVEWFVARFFEGASAVKVTNELDAMEREQAKWMVSAGLERAAVIAEGMAEEVTDGYSGRGMTCVRIAAAIRAEAKRD